MPGPRPGDVQGGPRYALTPLLGVIERVTGRPAQFQAIANALGVSRFAVHQAHTRGLSRYQADEWTVRLTGLHPALIWPEWGEWTQEGAA